MKRTIFLLTFGLCLTSKSFASPINLTFTPPDLFPLFSEATVTISGLITYSDPGGFITSNTILDPYDLGADDVIFSTTVGSGQSETIALLPDSAEVVWMTGKTTPTPELGRPILDAVSFNILWGVLAGDGVDGWIPFKVIKSLPSILTDFQIVSLGSNLGSEVDNVSTFSKDAPVLSLTDPGGDRVILSNGGVLDNDWYASYTPSGGLGVGDWGTLQVVSAPSTLALLLVFALLLLIRRTGRHVK